jgi:(+)-trans-carveol dehydrogenase
LGKLDGKVALISGAARGQGRSHALTLAREGADIIAFDICKQLPGVEIPMSRPEDLDETAQLVSKTGRRVLAMQGDVRDTASLDAVVEAGLGEFGHIDVVVANAGIDSIAGTVTMPDEIWDQMIAVNLTGVFKTIRAALPSMIRRGTGGSIVVTSSCAGLRPYPNHVHYVASKYGVIGVTQAVALEVAHYRIRCNAVAPAAVKTDLVVNPVLFSLFTGNPNATIEDATPVFKTLNLIDEPWVEPRDVSNAVLWLASDDSRYVTGIVLPIDLGLLIKGSFNASDAAARLDGSNVQGVMPTKLE